MWQKGTSEREAVYDGSEPSHSLRLGNGGTGEKEAQLEVAELRMLWK